MVRLALARHKATELGQHPGSSWTGNRRRGCRSVGRGGGERYAAYLPWLPRCVCAGGPAKYGRCQRRPGRCQDLAEESRGHPGYRRRPRIGCGEVVPGRCSALGLRVVPGPIAVFASGAGFVPALPVAFDEVALAEAIEVGFAFPIAFGVTVAYALALAVTVAYALALVIPLADGLRQVSRRQDQPSAGLAAGSRLILSGGLVTG